MCCVVCMLRILRLVLSPTENLSLFLLCACTFHIYIVLHQLTGTYNRSIISTYRYHMDPYNNNLGIVCLYSDGPRTCLFFSPATRILIVYRGNYIINLKDLLRGGLASFSLLLRVFIFLVDYFAESILML